MKTLTLACSVAVATVLSGCTGQQMTRGDVQDARFVGGEVKMVPITSDVVSAPAPKAVVPQELLAYQGETYKIQPGDTLIVTVWDHPELTTPAGNQQQAVTNGRLVQPDGTFYFPYAGKLNVTGMTIEDLRSTLTSRLAKYLTNPQLDVNVVGFGSRVALQGAFVDTTPQEVTTVPLTLSQAIGRARIDVPQADLSGLVLTRDGRNYNLDLDALNRDGNVAQDIFLRPGDRLYLPFNDRKEVYVIGEVMRPQALTFKTTDLTLTQAIGRSGGLNPITSKGEAVYVIRGLEDMPQPGQSAQSMQAMQSAATVYHLDAKSPVAFALGDRFRLQPGDVVWVGPAGITRWNRFLSQLLPLSSLVTNAASAQYDIER
ncbi:polysaccharide biosynthesis/export family protein [Lysobacter changpingensis]|uniref:polysaccharide biosynthesis/export family protein n=1 Tax=Lysobacter changpingensis TaxID=2792784 RepID=UPI001F5CC651|nr:polysaccharide biosynthesis/export family protein [Lysobacter changpingensis]